ncbi:MAG TPA: TolC family protein [Verrucomicrobiae bacterium]|nr:TolC family protein [Verrucomicrobiae bacterium]
MKKVGAVVLGLWVAFAAVAQDMIPPARPDVIPISQTNTVPSATNAPVTLTNAIPTLTNAPEQSITLDEFLQAVLLHNYDIAIQRLNPEIAAYDVTIGYAAYDPTFDASITHTYSKTAGGFNQTIETNIPGSTIKNNIVAAGLTGVLPFGTTYNLTENLTERYGVVAGQPIDSSSGNIGVNITQPLLRNFWMNQYLLAIKVGKNRLNFSEQGFRLQVISTITAAEQAYYDLIADRENVQVQRAALDLADQLLAENRKRVEVGTMAPLDEKQAESQLESSRADLISAERALTAQENIFKEAMSGDYAKIHDIIYVPLEALAAPVQIFDLQSSWGKGMTMRPDLIQARLNLEQQGIQLKYNRNQLFPELDVFGSYGYGAGGPTTVDWEDATGDLESRNQPFYSYGASISMPLSNAKARAAYKQTKLTVQQALLTLKQFEQNVLVEIDDAIKQAQSDYQSVEATRSAREYAEAALDAEQKKLQSGKSTSFVVLSLQKDLTTARSAEITALANYNKSLAALAQQEGSTLDRRGISVKVEK